MSVLNVFKTSVDTINASSITSDMTIGANLNGGSLTIGSANATVNIPSGTINAKYFTLRQTTYGNATNTFLIDTTQKTTFTTQIGIADTNAEEVYIGNGAQLKKIVIANVATTGSSEINIGNSNSTTSILSKTTNIANVGLVAGATVNIASGNNEPNTYVQVGTNSLPNLYLRAGYVNINDNGNGSINLGTTWGSGAINLYRPLTPGYSYPITTGTGNYPFNQETTVRENDKIGYCYYIPLTSVSPVTFNNVQTIRQVLTVPRGVYMVSYTVALNSGICTGFQGFIVTGLNFNNNTTIFPSGYNYYQSGYSQIRGYTISAPTALTGSCPVFIHDGSNHNTIAIATTFESDGGSSTGTILTSMTVVRIA